MNRLRAPALPLCGEPDRRLSDLLGLEHILLAFHGANARDAGGDRELSALADAVHERDGAVVADGHIGFRAGGARAPQLLRYLEQMYGGRTGS